MKKEIKQRWVDALRSGKYQQGKGALRRVSGNVTHSFCCLGVLCDIAGQDGIGKWDERPKGSDTKGDYFAFLDDSGHPVTGYISTAVMRWAGLSSTDPRVGNAQLSTYNDGDKTFAEIADLIEKHL